MEQTLTLVLGFAILCQAVGFYFRLLRGVFRVLTRMTPAPVESRTAVAALLPDEEGDE
jgi:hypothetical protein